MSDLRKITITASVEAVCPTGPFQNQRFAFGLSEVIEVDNDTDLRTKHEEAGNKCYSLFKAFEQKATEERIALERKDFRFYKLANGDSVPSVTTFLNYDADFFISAELLQEYASQGTLVHKMCSHYFAKKEWVTDPKKIVNVYPELWTDFVITKKGQVAFDPSKFDLPAFLEKFPFKATAWDVKVVNEKDRYGGELDVYGEFEGKQTIADFKRTPDKVKNFCQLASYAKGLEAQGVKIEQLMIIPSNPDTKQHYSKPILTTEIDKYYAIALTKRNGFKKRYGI